MEVFTEPGAPLLRDPGDVRIRDLPECSWASIVGIPWDWSVTGRPGARTAPARIRGFLYSYTPHNISLGELGCRPRDWGDVRVAPGDWAATRGRIREAARTVWEDDSVAVFLGGDHSVTEPILDALDWDGLGLVVLDHHYDLRSTSEGLTSGSWLYNVLSRRRIPTLVIGVGDYANPPYLRRRAEDLGVRVVPASDALSETVYNIIDSHLDNVDRVYISVDMDHIDQAYAPGVNSPAVLGMDPWTTLKILHHITSRASVVGVDIVEVTPPLDRGDSTSRLAAKIALYMLHWLEAGRDA